MGAEHAEQGRWRDICSRDEDSQGWMGGIGFIGGVDWVLARLPFSGEIDGQTVLASVGRSLAVSGRMTALCFNQIFTLRKKRTTSMTYVSHGT